MEAPPSTGFSQAPGEYDYGGETQGATQQASQTFYANDVHPMDRPFFGCLQPCNSALRRIDFVKTRPIVRIGRGPNNDFNFPGMRISLNHCQIKWDGCEDGRSNVTVHDNSTNGTWINGARINRGQSAILRDGNEIAFGSPMQQQSPVDDYRYIYRHLAPVELNGVHAFYDMAHELGRGTFATVMKAMSRTTGEWWAVKIIHTQKLRASNNNSNNNNDNNGGGGGENNNNNRKDSAHYASLAREVSILEQLDHPNICRLRETFVPDVGGNDLYLVLEYIDGGDLLDFILTQNGLEEPMGQHITRQMCSALSYVHEKGITHRDLKPENVLLTKDNPPTVKVADFGLAKAVDSFTMLRTMCGTPNYLAPEVVMEGVRVRGYDHLVDSWSVGVIVFSMLTNTGPFVEDENEPDVIRRIAGRKIAWHTLHEVGVSATAQDFIRRLLEADPTRRMSLTEALRHPWLDSSAESAGDASQPSALARYPIDRSLSDVSELSELPEEDNHGGANGDASMISALPSSSDMLGVQGLNINSPDKARARRPLERRSKVLARELAAEAEAHPSPEAEAETAEPVASASTPPTSNRNSGTGGKRRRPESSSGGGSPGDAAMGGESADSDEAGMDVDPQPPASKRGRRSQSKEQQAPGMPPTVKNGNGNGSGRVTRSKAAGPAGVQRR